MSNLLINQVEIGPMENFIYYIGDTNTKDVVVVDPAWDVDFILQEAEQNNLNIKGILVTHGHADHTNGVEGILKKCDVPVYINKNEMEFFKFKWGKENVVEVRSGDDLKVGNINIKFVHTPGHTPGSQCFHVYDNLVAGDTLFINGCGRCDMPGGDVEQMFDTIYNKLMKMNDNTIVFPGHNYSELKHDTLLNQKKTNPFMQYENLHGFVGRRLPKLHS